MLRLSDIGSDVRLALRLLGRRPGFAAIAIITLALGIGAPTAIYSIVRAVLLRPLPYPEPDRIVRFRIDSRSPNGPVSFDALPVSAALAWSTDTRTLETLAIFNDRALTLSTADGPYRLTGVSATPNLFDLLRVRPARGRTFRAGTADTHELVLSYPTWKRFFNGDPAAIDTTVTMDGEPYRIVGVMPEAFAFPAMDTAFWVPVTLTAEGTRGMLLPTIARLRPGATLAAVVEEGTTRFGDWGDPRITTRLLPITLQDQMVGGVRRILWVLLTAVVFVLVIATANIALLLLTHGAAREREFSIRLALGARRSRLVRQLFAESLVLGAIGGGAGLVVAWLGLEVLLRLAPADIPRLQDASLDGQVLSVAVGLTLATSLVFGTLSVGRTLALDLLRSLARGTGDLRVRLSGVASQRLNLLASAELALTMVLLVGAGLLLKSFVGLLIADQGFEPRETLAWQITLPAARYPTPAARMAFHARLLEQLARADGVTAAGIAVTMPNGQPTGRFIFSAHPITALPEDPFSMPTTDVHMISEGFIEAMGLRLVEGRGFQDTDGPGAERVVMISEALAHRQFPDRNPVGALLYSPQGNWRVVGVVGDVRPAQPGSNSTPAAYLPLRQNVDPLQWFATVTAVARGPNPRWLVAPMRALVLALDPAMPPFNVRGLDEDVSRLVAAPRFSAAALAGFAFVALVMATVGVYGVMSYSTGLRTREIGIRMALGSSRAQVLWLVTKDGVIVVLGGLGTGLLAGLWLARALTGLLYEVRPADPLAVASTAVILASAALAAALLPARRATRVNALDALRHE